MLVDERIRCADSLSLDALLPVIRCTNVCAHTLRTVYMVPLYGISIYIYVVFLVFDEVIALASIRGSEI